MSKQNTHSYEPLVPVLLVAPEFNNGTVRRAHYMAPVFLASGVWWAGGTSHSPRGHNWDQNIIKWNVRVRGKRERPARKLRLPSPSLSRWWNSRPAGIAAARGVDMRRWARGLRRYGF